MTQASGPTASRTPRMVESAVLNLDLSNVHPNKLEGMQYWIHKCKDSGRVCGRAPTGNCMGCGNGMVPPAMLQLAEIELSDQPEGALIPGLDLRTHRWFPNASDRLGVLAKGWHRVYNGSYVRALWNVIRAKSWKSDLAYLQKHGLRLITYDASVPLTADMDLKDFVKRRSALYIEPAGGDGVPIPVDGDTMEAIEAKVASAQETVPLTPKRYLCPYCPPSRGKRKMEKRDDGSYCLKCNKRRTQSSAEKRKRSRRKPKADKRR